MTRLEPSLATLDGLEGYDALCLFITEDERPLSGVAGFLDWRLCGGLSRVLKSAFFTGAPNDKLLVPSLEVPAPKTFVIGLGRTGAVTQLAIEHAVSAAAVMLVKAQVKGVAVGFSVTPAVDDAAKEDIVKRALEPSVSKVGLFSTEK